MSKHDDDLEKLGKALEQHEKSPKKTKVDRVIGHRTNIFFYIIIGLLILIILAILVSNAKVTQELKEQQATTEHELEITKTELNHYKTAYEVALEDAQAFGKMYGLQYEGEEKGDESTTTSEEKEDVLQLPKLNVWQQYSDQGIITDACISTTKLVETPNDIVEIVIIAEGKKDAAWPRLTLLIDGAVMKRFTINNEEETVYKLTLNLPKGTHYLDLLYDNDDEAKEVTISKLRIGDRTLETSLSVIDEGSGFAMFDCQETKEGNVLKHNGAMRFRIEKI